MQGRREVINKKEKENITVSYSQNIFDSAENWKADS
jgi:hypothetical protein